MVASNRPFVCALALLATFAAGCSEPQAGAGLTAADSALPASVRSSEGSAGLAASAESPAGGFRIRPVPDATGVVTLSPGERVVINAAAIARSHPGAELMLKVIWGDGAQRRTACGPCRLDHVYEQPGRFKLEASLPSGEARAVEVVVQDPPAPAERCESLAPPENILVNTGTRAMTWTEAPGATSYNVYVKTVEDCDMLEYLSATTSDPKWADVSSPFDLSSFDRCRTCYYIGVTAVRGSCETVPLGAGFALRPCR
jgi:hypothetical protein